MYLLFLLTANNSNQMVNVQVSNKLRIAIKSNLTNRSSASKGNTKSLGNPKSKRITDLAGSCTLGNRNPFYCSFLSCLPLVSFCYTTDTGLENRKPVTDHEEYLDNHRLHDHTQFYCRCRI